MKKLLFVSNTSWSIYNFRLGLMRVLREREHRIKVLAPFDRYSKKIMEEGFEFTPIKLSGRSLNPVKDLILLYRLYLIYKKEKPDRVFHYTIKLYTYGPIAARLAKTKCINTVTGLGYVFMKENLLSKIVKFLYKVSFKFPEKVFFQNEDDLQFFTKNNIVSKDRAILVKGSGVNTDYFHPEFCEQFERDDTSFIFLFIGRLLWDKGVGELVEATKIIKEKYPNIKVQLLSPPYKSDNPSIIPEEKVKEWQASGLIELLEPAHDVRPYMCKSDVVVLPSYYREGIPRSLIEACSMGRPIITTNSVGCKEVVDDGINGFLVPVKDVKTLVDAMIKIIELSDEKREKMGKRGREKVLKEFDERIVIKKYLEILPEISELDNRGKMKPQI